MQETRLGNIYGDDKGTGYAGNVWDKNCIAPALTTMQGGQREPMVIENVIIGGMQEHQSVKTDGICTTLTSAMGTGGGYVPMILRSIKLGNASNSNQRCAVYDESGLSPTIQAAAGGGGNQQPMWLEIKQATKEGFIPCKIGGGGRPSISNKQNEERKSDRERRSESNTDNGEYP